MARDKKASSSTAAPRPRRRAPTRYHHGDLRRALLDAARAVVAKDGVDAVRLNALAKRLRVSVAAPFRHFASKDALLVALAEEGATRMVDAMNAAAAAASDPLEAERARGVAYVRFVVSEPGYFRVLARKEILAQSPLLAQMESSQHALMEAVLGRHHAGDNSPALVQRSAGLLAAQALTYGLARMIDDGILGDVDVDAAAALAVEVTDVLGRGLIPR
jgi:AcrR family transcriptional regulator